MASESRAARLAVLIDADNISARLAGVLFKEIAKIGEASVRRIYGDFSGTQLQPWADILATHAITPQQNFANIKGKNASDIALVIDAMDLLHNGRLEGFCLVSSDSDFTRLAERIREQGIDVYGFGAQKTPESFRQACRRFIDTEDLTPEAQGANRDQTTPSKPPSVAVRLLLKAIEQLNDQDGWVHLAEVGKRLKQIEPDFDPRTYGENKLMKLVKKTDFFDLREIKSGGPQIRVKPSNLKASKKAS